MASSSEEGFDSGAESDPSSDDPRQSCDSDQSQCDRFYLPHIAKKVQNNLEQLIHVTTPHETLTDLQSDSHLHSDLGDAFSFQSWRPFLPVANRPVSNNTRVMALNHAAWAEQYSLACLAIRGQIGKNRVGAGNQIRSKAVGKMVHRKIARPERLIRSALRENPCGTESQHTQSQIELIDSHNVLLNIGDSRELEVYNVVNDGIADRKVLRTTDSDILSFSTQTYADQCTVALRLKRQVDISRFNLPINNESKASVCHRVDGTHVDVHLTYQPSDNLTPIGLLCVNSVGQMTCYDDISAGDCTHFKPNSVLANDISRFKWASISGRSVRRDCTYRIASRRNISLLDSRSQSSRELCSTACLSEEFEMIGSICEKVAPSGSDGPTGLQFYCATSLGLHLIDERMIKNGRVVCSWYHLDSNVLPFACRQRTLAEGGGSLVVTQSRFGRTYLYRERANCGPAAPFSDVKSMGRTFDYISPELVFDKQSIYGLSTARAIDLLSLPTTGLAFTKFTTSGTTTLYSANHVGQLFSSTLATSQGLQAADQITALNHRPQLEPSELAAYKEWEADAVYEGHSFPVRSCWSQQTSESLRFMMVPTRGVQAGQTTAVEKAEEEFKQKENDEGDDEVKFTGSRVWRFENLQSFETVDEAGVQVDRRGKFRLARKRARCMDDQSRRTIDIFNGGATSFGKMPGHDSLWYKLQESGSQHQPAGAVQEVDRNKKESDIESSQAASSDEGESSEGEMSFAMAKYLADAQPE